MTWIFGYGSLMWQPGFTYDLCEPAQMQAYHRWFCMVSTKGRGTPEIPGMMLGLVPGGSCIGKAYRITPGKEHEALAYLDEREGENKANRRIMVPVRILARPGSVLESAWTYLPMVSYPNYVGVMGDLAQMVELIIAGVGRRGSCHEYLRNLMNEVNGLGVEEPRLAALLEHVNQALAAQNSAKDAGATTRQGSK